MGNPRGAKTQKKSTEKTSVQKLFTFPEGEATELSHLVPRVSLTRTAHMMKITAIDFSESINRRYLDAHQNNIDKIDIKIVFKMTNFIRKISNIDPRR